MAIPHRAPSVKFMKWLDMPPVWLIACLVAAWGLGVLLPSPAFGLWAVWAGPLLVIAGVALTAFAVIEFRRAATTIIPGHDPSALVTSGVYRYSRNPIYLADVAILTGLILYWNALVALPLVLVFIWILRARFIMPEERRLAQAFPAEFEAYRRVTRRWM